MAGKGSKRRPEAERGLFDAGFDKLCWPEGSDICDSCAHPKHASKECGKLVEVVYDGGTSWDELCRCEEGLAEEVIRDAIQIIISGYTEKGGVMETADKVFAAWFVSVMLFFIILVAAGTLQNQVTTLTVRLDSLHVTPQQLDSALVEAAYRLLSERDSTIRECAKKLGPLNPECRL